MIRLITVAAASLLALVLTGCGEENKPAAPAATNAAAPADAGAEQKPAEQGH